MDKNMKASNSRKRFHSPEKDSDECLPISKRIHRLQIEPEGTSSTEEEYKHLMRSDTCVDQASPEEVPPSPWTHPVVGAGDLQMPPGLHVPLPSPHIQPPLSNQCMGPISPTQLQPHGPSANQGALMVFEQENTEPYNPELQASDNPHYYHINRLLYQANSSRVIRSRSSLQVNNELEQNPML